MEAMPLKALSIHPYYAQAIAAGEKTIEVRTWKTDYRGDILICSTAKKLHGTIPGHALCVVRLVDVVPLKRKHLQAAMLAPSDYEPGLYAWILEDNRLIEPIPLKGKLSLWNYDGPVNFLPREIWELTEDNDPGDAWFIKYWEPLMI